MVRRELVNAHERSVMLLEFLGLVVGSVKYGTVISAYVTDYPVYFSFELRRALTTEYLNPGLDRRRGYLGGWWRGKLLSLLRK